MNRNRTIRTVLLLVLSLAALRLEAQRPPYPLQARESTQLYRQIGDLMEATSIAAPELARAGTPLIANVRQSAETLQERSTREHVGVLYQMLRNARIYLEISEVVPKPDTFSEDVQKQLTELRGALDRAELHFRASLDTKEQRLRNPDRDNLRRYAEDNRTLGPSPPTEKRVVFLGDSITDGWRLNQYFPDKPYVNRGIGGQITGEMLGRMKADVLDLKPTAMVVLAGTNDLARGVSIGVIKNNLTMIADLAISHDVEIIFSSILPVSDYHVTTNGGSPQTTQRPPASILELNRWLQEMCKTRGLVYLDYFSSMVDTSGQLQASLAEDGLHPNAAGYKIMAPLALAAIDHALRSPAPPAKKKRFGIF
jgi:lysophospholipase L1-like esterase